MAIRIANLMKTIDFVWDKDPAKGTEDESVFVLRHLDAYEQAYINDRMTSMEDVDFSAVDANDEASVNTAVATAMSRSRVEAYKTAVSTTEIVLVEIRKVLDDEGNELELKLVKKNIGGKTKMVADPEFVRSLPVDLCLAIYNRVMKANTVSETDQKNSKAA